MGEDGLKHLVIGSILSVLFVMAVFIFFINTATNYGKDPSEITYGHYDFSKINKSLSELESTSEDMRETSKESTNSVDRALDTIGTLFSATGTVFKMYDFVIDGINLVFIGTLDIIFKNAVLTGAIVGLLLIIVLFAVLRMLVQGS